jgi:hypothetical protein
MLSSVAALWCPNFCTMNCYVVCMSGQESELDAGTMTNLRTGLTWPLCLSTHRSTVLSDKAFCMVSFLRFGDCSSSGAGDLQKHEPLSCMLKL